MLIDGFPAYLRDVNGASLTSAGLASAAPQVAVALLTTLGAVVADYLRGPRGPGRLSTRAVRRLMHTMGTGCNAVLLLLVGAGCVRVFCREISLRLIELCNRRKDPRFYQDNLGTVATALWIVGSETRDIQFVASNRALEGISPTMVRYVKRPPLSQFSLRLSRACLGKPSAAASHP